MSLHGNVPTKRAIYDLLTSCIFLEFQVVSGAKPLSPAMARTFLVIDDNQSVRESLKFLLLRRGYQVLVAEDGYEALRLAAVHPVDAAMVDVNMPGMNGIEVCRALREYASKANREIAIWLMTGGRSPDLVRQGREAGALDLLGKPFDLAALYRRFEDYFASVDTAGANSRTG